MNHAVQIDDVNKPMFQKSEIMKINRLYGELSKRRDCPGIHLLCFWIQDYLFAVPSQCLAAFDIDSGRNEIKQLAWLYKILNLENYPASDYFRIDVWDCKNTFSFMADEPDDIVTVFEEQISVVEKSCRRRMLRYVQGIVELPEKTIYILDTDKLLADCKASPDLVNPKIRLQTQVPVIRKYEYLDFSESARQNELQQLNTNNCLCHIKSLIQSHRENELETLVDEYIKNSLGEFEAPVCKNAYFDFFLQKALAIAGENGIHLICDMNFPRETPVSCLTLRIILGTLLENAMTRCISQNREDKTIVIKVNSSYHKLHIRIMYSEEEMITSDVTDMIFHNIISITKSNGGSFSVQNIDGMLTADVSLNFEKSRKKDEEIKYGKEKCFCRV